jgi:nucleotide-binding universal stress UspA family protein
MNATTAQTRIRFSNIVFATDFSPAAAAALPYAARLAQHFEGNLFVVHAQTPDNYAVPAVPLWEIEQALEEQTDELKKTLQTEFPNVPREVLVARGGAWEVIEAAAQKKKSDLIVVGTSGRGGIGKFLLGSVAEEIVRRAMCPVLVVGPHFAGTGAHQPPFRRILYATDFEGSSGALGYAVAMAQEHLAHLTLLHVMEHPKAGDLVSPRELEAASLDRLRGFVSGDAQLWCEPRAIVAHGAAAEKILEFAEREQADLIVLGIRNAKGIGRATHLPGAVAHQVISHATCPVLTVRD